MDEEIKCLQCNKKIVGRSDKKFCDSYCRNSYNNRIIRKKEKMILGINSVLRKNRTILKSINPEGRTTVKTEYLKIAGFDFRYFTHLQIFNSGNIYRFCYDYGYMPVDDNKILIINWQPYMNKNFDKTKINNISLVHDKK